MLRNRNVRNIRDSHGSGRGNESLTEGLVASSITAGVPNSLTSSSGFKTNSQWALNLIVAVVIFSTLHSLVSAEDAQRQTASKQRIIFDTDMGSDCDDVGALALLHHYADEGSAEILGCIYSSTHISYGVGVIDAINTYYGRPDIPIGANRAKPVGDTVDKMEAELHARQPAKYGHDLISTNDAEEDVPLLRRLLANQPDHSVTYVTVGHTASLYGLLISPADDSSPLIGKQLVAKKIKQWVALGALRANTGDEKHYAQDWNFFRNGTAKYTAHLIKEMPIRCVFINAGTDVLTGKSLATLPADSIVRCTYETWLKKVFDKKLSDQRPSWDLAAVYYAVEGLGDFLYEEKPGQLLFDATKGAQWIRGKSDADHLYICQKEGIASQFSELLNDRISQLPKNLPVVESEPETNTVTK